MAFDPATAALALPTADPLGPHVAASCFEFLLIELVPLAYRIAGDRAAREEEMVGATAAVGGSSGAVAGAGGGGSLGIGGIGGSVMGLDEDETREAVFWRLDGLGYRVGLAIVER
jgi:trafficking protein particle complex subunit 6